METEQLSSEVWREVPGFEGISVNNNNGFKRLGINRKGRINHNYRLVRVGHNKEVGYHVLVARAFPEICGEWFEGAEVHHKDFNRLNNIPENLVVIDAHEHRQLHYRYLGDKFKKASKERSESISKALTGKRSTYKHIPILQFSLDGELIKEWECINDVVSEGFSPGNICSCCKGKLKTAYGFKWVYKHQ